MARYYYVVTNGGEELWVDNNGNFEQLGDKDKPSNYSCTHTNFQKAKNERVNLMLKTDTECGILQFEAKKPWKYIGKLM